MLRIANHLVDGFLRFSIVFMIGFGWELSCFKAKLMASLDIRLLPALGK